MITPVYEYLAAATQAALAPEAEALSTALVELPPLEPFTAGALGQFPYFWQNPATLRFSATTYAWINTNVIAGGPPVRLDEAFTGYFVQALGAISYALSTADANKLTAAYRAAVSEQAALLLAWQNVFGTLPEATPPQQPVDAVLWTMATQWAKPATTLAAMRASADLNALLNAAPQGTGGIISAAAAFLATFTGDVSLVNAVSLNTGLLQSALTALQRPSTSNGGLITDDGVVHPAWAVTTPLADILAGLEQPSTAIPLLLTASRTKAGVFAVSIEGGGTFEAQAEELLAVRAGGQWQGVLDAVPVGESSTIELSFTGVTMVDYGPVAFDPASGTNWFWMQPVTDAIRNGNADVTGFRFSPAPRIDFSRNGPFGFLTAVAISRLPRVTVTTPATNRPMLDWLVAPDMPVRILAGDPMTLPVTCRCDVATGPDTVSATFTPLESDSRAWVLGVMTDFPAAGAV